MNVMNQMNIKLNSELVIFVTHVEADHTFLKICGQVDKNSAKCVERMILPLVEQFARNQDYAGPNSVNLSINSLCCAKFQNEGYYRAKIRNINDDTARVKFIDYGNFELVPKGEIHSIDTVPGAESLRSLPPLALEFILMHVLPANGKWDDETIESIAKALRYNEFTFIVRAIVSNDYFIRFLYNDEDFSELLIRKHIGRRATLDDMYRSLGMKNMALPEDENMIPLYPKKSGINGSELKYPLCCTILQKYMYTSAPEALVYKSRILDVTSKHDVYVSYVDDGPNKFSVQLQSISQVLSKLMRDINNHPVEPLQEPPLPGFVCLGRYTKDKALCRAVVMSVMEKECKLYYVDFGHTEVLPYTDIFKLPAHFIYPKVLSVRFTLSGLHKLNITDKMKEYFKQIVSGKLLTLHVCSPEGPPLIQYGELYDNGINIKDILKQAFPNPVMVTTINYFEYQRPKILARGETEFVYVSFVESCRKFFVQIEDYVSSLELIMNDLADLCTARPILNQTQLKAPLPCAALCDNQWYRAQILSAKLQNIRISYVDYGNEETVTPASLRPICVDLVQRLPAQAIKCILSGYEMFPFTQEVHNRFELLTLEKRLRLKVVEVTSDGLVVDLYEPEQNKNIKSQMLDIIKNEENWIKEPLNYQDAGNQHSTKLKIDQSENKNKLQKKNQPIPQHQIHNSSTAQEKNMFKSLKNESSKSIENRNVRSNGDHNDSRNERFNRDESSNNHSAKHKWSNRHDCNDSSKNGKGTRGNRNKASDTPSKGNTQHAKSRTNCDSYSRDGGIFERMQSNKFSDRNNYENCKSGKTNSDYHDSNEFKENKGQGYRLVQNKSNIANYSDKEEQRYSPTRYTNEFYIPCHNITFEMKKTCEVVFLNSLCDFFIQFSSDYDALDSMMENIASIYEAGGELIKESDIFCGLYCIAQYSEDLKWYRAVIKSIEGNSATVQFVDYGNMETIKFDKIKSIQEEFLKLPIQAVHCKLFDVWEKTPDLNKIKAFENRVAGETLEARSFSKEESGIYSILLYKITGDEEICINDEFCEKLKVVHAIEASYVPFDAEWPTISYPPETKKDVIITWFTNPNNFYCQILDNEDEFKSMMNEIQRTYVDKKPVSFMLKTGSPVIATFSDDGVLYRAEIIELNKRGHLVQYIDFGNTAIVDTQKIYPVAREFMNLPRQAVQCSLLNVAPLNGSNWSEADNEAIDNCFNVDKFTCILHDKKDDKYLISLNNNGNNVANMLAELNLASLFNSDTKSAIDVKDNNTLTPTIKCNIERMDINLLNGQALRVKVSSTRNISEFYVQLPSATECENIINTYMADKNPEVMQRLSTHEICLGTGCLVYSNGVWRRAVISSHSQSTGFDVKFIDTGAYDEILSDSVLALPGELSVMQNQSIECSLVKTTSISETDIAFKELIEGKEVIIYVEEIDNNRLIVKLFDLNGNKINISGRSDEKLLPICPMPILSSTYKVTVSHADHSASVWLQRSIEYTLLEKTLTEALDQYYPISGKLLEPKVGLLCAVRSVYGHWRRARILQYSETKVYVNLLDYGYNEEVSLDVVMELDSQFYKPHQLAINVSLTVVLNNIVIEQLYILQYYLAKRELTAVFYNVNKKWVAELLYKGAKISDEFRHLNLMSEQKIFAVKEPQIHNMTEGYRYKVTVSHVDSPSQFWLQHVDDATDLSNKQRELQKQALTFSKIDGILEEGSLCLAMYTIDNLWYRAEVLDADEDITTVRFIDYGNTDVIDNKSGNIRQISDSWKEIKEYAIKCRLDVIPLDVEGWSVTTCEKFENLVKRAESLEAVVIGNNVPKRVDLLINNKSVREILIENHRAVEIHTEEELIDEIIDLELDPYSAFVCHINSPNEFWVQEEKSVGDLEIMTDRFIVAHMFPKVDEIKENLLCVAKYPDDGCWYRARVLSHSDSVTRVIYIDYGNSAASTEIRAIPSDLADIPPLSRKCRLIMPEGITEWSEKACKEFVTLAADGITIFLLDVIEEGETSLVKLTLDGKNVTDILVNFCERHPPIIEERLPPLGEENSPNVFVSRINSPDEFWIQTESNTTDLNIMLERLQAAPSFLPLSIFETGTICAANYLENGQWRRAKILSHSKEGTEVLYIDYGNITVTNETRMLPADIINIPPLSKCCALQKPNSINSWPLDACKIFEELAAGGKTMFQFEILDDTSDIPFVKLNFNGKNIVDILVPSVENISENVVIERVNETSKEEDVDINRLPENSESQNQKIEENTDNSCLNTNYVVELTVDEIVQNMKMDKPVKHENTFNGRNNIIVTNEIDKITENLEHLKTQAEIETYSDKNEMQDIKDGNTSNLEELVREQSVKTLEGTTTSSLSINVLKEKTNSLSTDDKEKSSNKDSNIQNANEVNVNITDSKSCSDVSNMNEKVSSGLRSIEITSNEFKITGRQDDDPLIDVTVSENITNSQDDDPLNNVTVSEKITDSQANSPLIVVTLSEKIADKQDDDPLIDVTVSEKITDSQDDDPLIVVTVSEKITESNNIENSSQHEDTPTISK